MGQIEEVCKLYISYLIRFYMIHTNFIIIIIMMNLWAFMGMYGWIGFISII